MSNSQNHIEENSLSPDCSYVQRLAKLEKELDELRSIINGVVSKMSPQSNNSKPKPFGTGGVTKPIQNRQQPQKKPTVSKPAIPMKPAEPVDCVKCKESFPPNLMFKVFDQSKGTGVTSFECANEKECDVRKNSEKYKKRAEEDRLNRDFKDLTKEEKLFAMYGIRFEDLIESPLRLRDASIHYFYYADEEKRKLAHEEEELHEGVIFGTEVDDNVVKYSWCWANNTWYTN